MRRVLYQSLTILLLLWVCPAAIAQYLYVGSYGDGSVKRYNASTGAFIDNFVPSGSGGLSGTHEAVFGPDGDLYVSSQDSGVLRFNGMTGAFIDVFASGGGLSRPNGLTFGPDGNLYVVSHNTNQIMRYNGTTGAYIDTFASDNLNGPYGLAFGPDSNLYVSSVFTGEIDRYNGTTGAYISTFIPGGSNGLSYACFLTFSTSYSILTKISPTSVLAGGLGFTLTVHGSGFLTNSIIDWTENKSTTPLTTTYVSSTQLTASVPASLIAAAGSAKIAVFTPGSGASLSKTIKILQTSLRLAVNSLVRNGDGSYIASISLKNTGYLAANNLHITKSYLGAAATSSGLPVSVGNVAAGSANSASLSFPSSAGASGATVTLKVFTTFTGGSSTNSIKVILP